MNKNIYAPLFTGFYNTIHDPDSLNDYIIQDIQDGGYYNIKNTDNLEPYELYDKYFNFDFNNYKKDYSKLYIDFLDDFINFSDIKKDIGIKNIKFEYVSSPKYYNYSNDNIIININLDIKKLKKYLIMNKNSFTKFIKENNQSYDGFICFLSDDFNEYIKFSDNIEACITQVIEFYINNKQDDFIDEFLGDKGSDIIEIFYNNNTFKNE